MSKKKRQKRYGRDAPTARSATAAGVVLANADAWKIFCADGYKPVIQCPEVQMCIGVYADLIASMTIRLMRNTDKGDVREKNELSRRLDIAPAKYMTRMDFMRVLVAALMGTGNQVTIPIYKKGLLEQLKPLPPAQVSLEAVGLDDYEIVFRGRRYAPDEVLHFRLNPDPNQPWRGRGYAASLQDVVKGIRQANATKQAIQESPSPSIIVKVDGLTDELKSVEGRKALAKQYLDASEDGRPWFIPSEAFSVEQVKPLTLSDLAIKDSLELDKRSVAAIFGVPPFMVGIGEYQQDAYQHFLTTRVMAVAREIEQVLTAGLLWSEDLYWSLNPRSLYNYALNDLINVGKEMVDRAAMRRNEWRDWMGMPPDPEMDELYLLENYLPTKMLGKQKKLNTGGGDEDGAEDEADANE